MANVLPTGVDAIPCRDAVARLSGIREALVRADAHGGGPAPDLDQRSDQLIVAASAGLAALSAVEGDGAASRELVDQIRRELAEISNLALS